VDNVGLTGSLHTAARARVVLVAVAAIVGLAVWAPSQAHASGCENSWTNNKGGSWLTAENWSKKSVPTSSEEVCITENGTYTVELNGAGATVKALTIGGSSGTQTLSVGSTCSFNAVLTTSGLLIGAQGALSMTNADGCASNVTVSGPVTNAGTITTVKAIGGQRNLQGNLTNKGTLAINGTTPAFNGSKFLLSNEGAINLAEGAQLSVSNASAVTNATGGKVVGTGTGNLLMGKETTFTQGAGTTSGTQPVFVDDGTLAYTGSGASLIRLRGTDTLSGSLSSGQLLSLESTCGENLAATAAASFSNAGSITLTNGDGCADNVTLALSEGTLTNTGTITTEFVHGGQRNLQGSLTNKGTIAINANSAYNAKGAALLNEGAINLAEGVQLSVSNSGSVTNATGGQIVGTGTGNLLMGTGTTFTEAAGTTSGTQPVFVDDGTLNYTGSGASLIRARGSDALSGASSPGQSLMLESTCGENLIATTAVAGFTNGGAITETNGDGCGDNVTISIPTAVLANTGTITTEPAHGGQRNVQGNLTNTGTLAINANSAFNGTKGLLVNEGAIDLAEGMQLAVAGASSVTNGAGGKIAGTGSGNLSMTGGTFTQGAGTTSGTQPVFVDNGTLAYTGSGASLIRLRGTDTLSGNLVSGQSLMLESTCGANLIATAAVSFSNAGSITETNGDGCGDNVTLALTEGTLTNTGTITTELLHGGQRNLFGSLTNKGTLALNASTTYNTKGATLLNEGALNIATGVTLSVSGGANVTNAAGTIAATGTGILSELGGTFTEGAGASTGSQPIVIDDATLHYTGSGSSTIALRGTTSTLSGTISVGQALSLQSTCSEHTTVSAGSFLNSGTITLTNGDGCGDNVTLSLAGGTLENKGTLNVEEPHGGTRTIEGSILSEHTVALGASATLKVTGSYTQIGKHSIFKTTIAGSSAFGALSASGAASITGELLIVQIKPFIPTAGEKFGILGTSALTGKFTKVKGNKIKKATVKHYVPVYTPTAVTLEAV
jgi:fibronectin-binding autotransporter adhesin